MNSTSFNPYWPRPRINYQPMNARAYRNYHLATGYEAWARLLQHRCRQLHIPTRWSGFCLWFASQNQMLSESQALTAQPASVERLSSIELLTISAFRFGEHLLKAHDLKWVCASSSGLGHPALGTHSGQVVLYPHLVVWKILNRKEGLSLAQVSAELDLMLRAR